MPRTIMMHHSQAQCPPSLSFRARYACVRMVRLGGPELANDARVSVDTFV